MDPFLDFGELYAVRRTFGPWECIYSLARDAQRNIILAALPLQAVYQSAPTARFAGRQAPSRKAAPTPWALPLRDKRPSTARDGSGSSTARPRRSHCLSPQGKLLLEYGGPATWDDTAGKGFAHPTGIAAVQVDGAGYLYVGDAGNLRIIKYRVH